MSLASINVHTHTAMSHIDTTHWKYGTVILKVIALIKWGMASGA